MAIRCIDFLTKTSSMYAELSARKSTVYPPRVPGGEAPRAQRLLGVPPQGVDGRVQAPVYAWTRHDGRSAEFRQNVARFRLYRHRFLQENTRFAAFFKIYQIIKLKILKNDKILQILQHLQKFC